MPVWEHLRCHPLQALQLIAVQTVGLFANPGGVSNLFSEMIPVSNLNTYVRREGQPGRLAFRANPCGRERSYWASA